MKIEHIALWVKDLERMKNFYTDFFNCTANKKYINTKKGFQSYFITFNEGARIELMQKTGYDKDPVPFTAGYSHLAISLGSREEVDKLTSRFRASGYTIAGEPRTTGDGYYESVIEDPEGNLIELTE